MYVKTHRFVKQLRILSVRLVLPHLPGANLRWIRDQQFETQFCYQPFEPTAVSAGFHPDADLDALVVKFAIELLRLVGMLQSPLPAFPVSVSTNTMYWKLG